MAQVTETFSAMDFTVFGLLLVISTVIGVFFAWKDRQNRDENNYALGGRVFTAWPVALSLTATSISAITMMGKFPLRKLSHLSLSKVTVYELYHTTVYSHFSIITLFL